MLVTLSPLARSDAGRPRLLKSTTGLAGIEIDPGNIELERGTSLLVVAKFHGAVPTEAELVVESTGQSGSRRGMTRSLEDPTFACRVESVETDLAYRVEFAGKSTETYRSEYLNTLSLCVPTPSWSSPNTPRSSPKTVEDIRHVTAVEGTELTLLVSPEQRSRHRGIGGRSQQRDRVDAD